MLRRSARQRSPSTRSRRILALLTFASIFVTAPVHAKDKVPWVDDLSVAAQQAASKNQLVLLHFWDANCPPCKRIEKNVFSEATFAHALAENYVPVKVKVSQNPDLARHFKIQAWPTDVIVTPQGEEVYRTISPQQQNAYQGMLSQVVWRYQNRPNGAPAGQVATASLPLQRSSTGAGPASDMTIPSDMQSTPRPNTNAPMLTANSATEFESHSYYDPRKYAVNASQAMVTEPPVAATSGAAHPESQLPSNGTAGVRDRFASAYEVDENVAPSDPKLVENPFVGAAATARQDAMTQRTSHESFTRDTLPGAAQGTASPSDDGTFSLAPPSNGNGAGVASVSAPQRPAYQTPPATNDLSAVAQFPSQPPRANPASASGASVAKPVPAKSLGMDGYCPVTLVDQGKWVAGDKRWGAHHRGRTYLFQSSEAQQKFLASPDRYSPGLAGFDPVVFAEEAEYRDGKRQHGVLFQNQIFLFASEETLSRFWESPQQYSSLIHQAMGTRETQFR